MQDNKEKSNVQCEIMDLFNAFNEMNNDKMIDKLLKSSLPKMIVKIIKYMLKFHSFR